MEKSQVPLRLATGGCATGAVSDRPAPAPPAPDLKFEISNLKLSDVFEAIRQVESAGKNSAVGDRGRSRGPFQISPAYWADSGVAWPYDTGVTDPSKCRVVMENYWRRYCPDALANLALPGRSPEGRSLDIRKLAAVHNGGPRGKPAGDYASRVLALAESFAERGGK